MNKRNALLGPLLLAGCSLDADAIGIGTECSSVLPCTSGLECTTSSVGGYCVMKGCEKDGDCPSDSSCLNHEDHGDCVRSCSFNYCIQTCILYHDRPEECFDDCPSFPECNVNRSMESPAYCVASDDGRDGMQKNVCLPLQ
jgi:hypothetical protein